MKKAVSILIIGFIVMALSVAPGFAGKKKICKLGHVNSPASIFQYGALAFKEAVEKELPDWTIEVYPAGQLGGTLALIQGLSLGPVDIYTEFISTFASLVPEYNVFGVHYKFDSVDEYELFMNSATFAKMNEKMIKKNGITCIGSMRAGSVYSHFSNKPLYKVEDAKGLINRVAQMAPAIDNPLLDMYDEKFHEAIKYVNRTNNLFNMISYNTSTLFWDRLKAKEKDVFIRAVNTASLKGRMEVEKRLGKAEAALKARGIKFIDTDTSGFKKAIKANINTILKDKDAIDIYEKIMNKTY